MTRKTETEPLLAEFADLSAMAAASKEERIAAPIRLAGDRAGSATSEQVRAERVRRDVADRLGVKIDPEAA